MDVHTPPVRQIQIVDLNTQYNRLKSEIDGAIQSVVDSGIFIGGPVVQRFTEKLTAYLDGCGVVTCANGTDALQIAYMALGLQPGDKVMIPSFNYVAAAEAAALLSLVPIFVDVNPETFNIDPAQIDNITDSDVKAIVVVHLFGQACDMDSIMEIAQKKGIPVIEDNAQAIGATMLTGKFAGRKLGTIGTIGTTSFFPSKNLGCMGDGGAVFTHNTNLLDRVKMISNHGQKVRYNYEIIGLNSRLDAIQAAILEVKLSHLSSFMDTRRNAAKSYSHHLSIQNHVIPPHQAPYSDHVFHQYTIKLKSARERNALKNYLADHGIQSMIYYPQPLHLQKAYQYLGYGPGSFPISEMLADQVLSLPIHSEMDTETVQYISDTIHRFFLDLPSFG